jgi:hypothetical protein
VDLSGFGPLTSSLQMKRTTAVLQARITQNPQKFFLSNYFMKNPFYEDNKSTLLIATFIS